MDKLLHLLVGITLAANPLQSADVALVTAVSAGVLKEIYDRKHKQKHNSEFGDAVATAAGALIVFSYRVEW